jgi:hypothetical protein
VTVHSHPPAVAPQTPELTWRRIMRLGVLGVASDFRDRRRDPALRNRPSAQALNLRLVSSTGTLHAGRTVATRPRASTTLSLAILGL